MNIGLLLLYFFVGVLAVGLDLVLGYLVCRFILDDSRELRSVESFVAGLATLVAMLITTVIGQQIVNLVLAFLARD